MTHFTIEKATLEQIPEIQSVAKIAFPETYKQILSKEQINYMMDWMYSTNSLIKQITEEQNQFFIAHLNNNPIGYVSIRPDGLYIYHLEKIYILPEFQKQHIGSSLFKHAIEYIRSINTHPCKIQLNVQRDNSAVSFYKKNGMKVIATIDEEIGDGFMRNDYIMELCI